MLPCLQLTLPLTPGRAIDLLEIFVTAVTTTTETGNSSTCNEAFRNFLEKLESYSDEEWAQRWLTRVLKSQM